MAISPLLPAAGALVPFVVRAVERLSEGIPFADVLHRENASAGAKGSQVAERTANAAPPWETETDNVVSQSRLMDLRRSHRRELEEFALLLPGRFAAAGVDTSVPIQLKSDGRGGVIVDGNHPDRARIEQLFASDASLREMFYELADAFLAKHRIRQSLDGGIAGQFVLQLDEDAVEVKFE